MPELDPKEIYTACAHMTRLMSWSKSADNEWSYIGEGNHFEIDRAQHLISQCLDGEKVYIVVDRHTAFPCENEQAAAYIQPLLAKGDVIACSTDFKKMLFFSSIGVVKHGKAGS